MDKSSQWLPLLSCPAFDLHLGMIQDDIARGYRPVGMTEVKEKTREMWRCGIDGNRKKKKQRKEGHSPELWDLLNVRWEFQSQHVAGLYRS